MTYMLGNYNQDTQLLSMMVGIDRSLGFCSMQHVAPARCASSFCAWAAVYAWAVVSWVGRMINEDIHGHTIYPSRVVETIGNSKAIQSRQYPKPLDFLK